MKPLLYTIAFLVISITGYSQKAQIQKNEYATLFLRVYYQGNTIIYDKKGLSLSPVFTSPDGRRALLYDHQGEASLISDEKGKFVDPGQIINYVASFGWTVKSNNILPYNGGGNNDTGSVINMNQYMLLVIFERPYIAPIEYDPMK